MSFLVYLNKLNKLVLKATENYHMELIALDFENWEGVLYFAFGKNENIRFLVISLLDLNS